MSKGEETRLKIIEIAARKAAREGLSQITIGTLAEETGMSKSGLFGHFGSKTALQRAVLEYYSSSFLNTVVKPALKEKGGFRKLHDLISRAQDWDAHIHSESGCPIIAASTELDDQPGELRDYLKKSQADYIQLIEGLVERTKHEGDFRDDVDAKQFAFEIYAQYLGFNFYRRMLRHDQAEQLFRNGLQNIINHAKT